MRRQHAGYFRRPGPALRGTAIALLMLVGAGAGAAQDAAAGDSTPDLPETYFPGLNALLDSAARISPRILARQADEALAEANRIVAQAGLLPAVNASAQFNGWQRDDRADLPNATNAQKLTYSLNLVQPIFHWGELRNNARIGALQLQVARGQTGEAYRMLLQEIRAIYLQLIVRKTALARAQFIRDLAAQQVRLAEERRNAGTASAMDVSMAKLNLAQLELAADRSAEDLESAIRLLAKLAGAAPLTAAQVPEAVPQILPNLAPLEAIATSVAGGKTPDTFGLQVLRHQLGVERLARDNANLRLKPKFNLVLGVNQDEQSYSSNIAAKYRVNSFYVGTQVNWPIFDGFATRGFADGALARQRQLEQSYKDMTATLQEQARSQFTQLGFSVRAMEITDLLLGMSETSLKSRQKDLAQGLASEADVNVIQQGLFDSRLNAFNNRIDFLMRLTEFLSTVAKDPALNRFNSPTP